MLSDYQETGLQYFLIPPLLGIVRARWKSFHSAWQIFWAKGLRRGLCCARALPGELGLC